jgi:folate-binding protein YgfZ
MLLGVPEGALELPPGDSVCLEASLDLLRSISFTKGCYKGQELIARTHFTGKIRKRLYPVLLRPLQDASTVPTAESAQLVDTLLKPWSQMGTDLAAALSSGVPESGMPIRVGGKKTGKLLAVNPEFNIGIAMLRIERALSDASSTLTVCAAEKGDGIAEGVVLVNDFIKHH